VIDRLPTAMMPAGNGAITRCAGAGFIRPTAPVIKLFTFERQQKPHAAGSAASDRLNPALITGLILAAVLGSRNLLTWIEYCPSSPVTDSADAL